jgi:hypothetical protein
MVQWLTLHLHKVSGSNIVPETGCPDWNLPRSSQYFQANARIQALIVYHYSCFVSDYILPNFTSILWDQFYLIYIIT